MNPKCGTSIFLITVLLSFTQHTKGANILFFLQFGSFSHRLAMWPLVEELSKTHNVTFHQLYPPKNPHPNVTEFNPFPIKKSAGEDKNFNPLLFRLKGGLIGNSLMYFAVPSIGINNCEQFLDFPETKEWIENNHFDLVVIDFLFNECGFGLAHKWGAKTIIFHTSHPTGTMGPEILGFMETGEANWITEICFTFQMPMHFIARVVTVLYTAALHLVKEWYYYPQLHRIFKEKLNMHDMPPYKELIQNTDLVFYNSHFSEELARSLPPVYVSIPAIHAWGKKPKALPKDIADFIDANGEDGFIYVSFGSEANPSTAPIEFQNILFESLSESNIPIVWKWPAKRPEGLSKNVFTAKWMPQFDILASPKCRAFIGHGGLLGMQESILNAVPLITIPFFAEQDYNADRLERMERGIKLDPNTLTKEKLKNAIKEILSNKKYKKNMLKVSKQLKDLQNSPLETAMFWTEYVLRNDDMSTLKPLKTKHYYWFQLQLLDVWAFILLISSISLYVFYYFVKLLCKCTRNVFTSKPKVKQN